MGRGGAEREEKPLYIISALEVVCFTTWRAELGGQSACSEKCVHLIRARGSQGDGTGETVSIVYSENQEEVFSWSCSP